MTAATNHKQRGTSANAVTRCAIQCPTPSLAEPRPTARPSGDRIRAGGAARIRDVAISTGPVGNTGDPGDRCQNCGRPDDDPTAGVGRPKIERMAGIPDQVPNAIAQVIEQCCGPAEQRGDPKPGSEKILHAAKG